MLTKDTVIDKIEILEDGVIQVRRAMRVLEDGVLVGERYARNVHPPTTDPASLPNKIAAIANIVWTPAVVQAYRDKLAAKA
jgi:hypothetical protein